MNRHRRAPCRHLEKFYFLSQHVNVQYCTDLKVSSFFPTPVGTPGGKPLRLTARVKIARARPDRFWPAKPFFGVSVCVSVCLWIQSVVPNLGARWENRRRGRVRRRSAEVALVSARIRGSQGGERESLLGGERGTFPRMHA